MLLRCHQNACPPMQWLAAVHRRHVAAEPQRGPLSIGWRPGDGSVKAGLITPHPPPRGVVGVDRCLIETLTPVLSRQMRPSQWRASHQDACRQPYTRTRQGLGTRKERPKKQSQRIHALLIFASCTERLGVHLEIGTEHVQGLGGLSLGDLMRGSRRDMRQGVPMAAFIACPMTQTAGSCREDDLHYLVSASVNRYLESLFACCQHRVMR